VAWFVFLTMPGEIAKGGWAWIHGYGRLIWLSKETEKADAEGKFSPKAESRRKARVHRCTATAIAAPFVALAAHLFIQYGPLHYRVIAGVALLAGMFATGHDWTRRRPVNRGPWDGTIEALRDAHVKVRIIDELDDIFPIGLPTPTGAGTLIVYDPGCAWTKVRDKRIDLAAELRVVADYVTVERGMHEAQVRLWIPTGDPFDRPAQRHPLLDQERWNAWEAAPFGRTPHGFEIPLTLMYSNLLLGGSPGSGKGWTARVAAAPFVLDPDARLFIANGKSSGDWKPLQGICGPDYVMGTTEPAMQRVSAMLDVLIEEMLRRNTYTEEHGVSKIVPQDGFAPWLAIFDEVHKHTGCTIPSGITRGRKELTWGEVVTEKLTTLVKEARSSAIVVVLMTQKPGAKAIPTDLRDPIGTRFSCRVGNSTTSEQVLGMTCKDGVDASTLPAKHRGIGILVPDAELNNLVDGYPTLRPDTIDDTDFAQLGARGLRLREEAGTVPAPPAEHPIPELLAKILDHAADTPDDQRVSSLELINCYAPGTAAKTFAKTLRGWGCPTGRHPSGKGPSGPLAGDIRHAAHRIRTTGIENVIEAA
jgi:S-DNA-T family DNA segregation ATPase FtsK/SpoIIIE